MDFVLRLEDDEPKGDVGDVCAHCEGVMTGNEKKAVVHKHKMFHHGCHGQLLKEQQSGHRQLTFSFAQ